MAILIFSRYSLLSTCRTTSKWVEHNWHGIRNTFTMFATCITEHWHNHEKVEMKNSVQTHNETKESVVFLLYLKFKNVRNISFNMFFLYFCHRYAERFSIIKCRLEATTSNKTMLSLFKSWKLVGCFHFRICPEWRSDTLLWRGVILSIES